MESGFGDQLHHRRHRRIERQRHEPEPQRPLVRVSTFSASRSAAYFDVQVTLPVGTRAPAGATVTVCLTNPSVASGYNLYYWSGSSWTAASNVSATGSQIWGSVPLFELTGTNFVAAPPAADYTLYYVAGIVVVVIVIALAVLMMRRSKKSS